MIKRIFDIARSNVKHFFHQRGKGDPENIRSGNEDFSFFGGSDSKPKDSTFETTPDPLDQYYANLEIPHGSNREEVKAAWKRLMKRYHPDLHAMDPAKRQTANELARRLTEAYQVLDQELMNKE